MKLLLVTDAVGGVWIYSLELARALRPLGIEPVLAVMGPSPSEAQRLRAEGLTLIDTGLPLDWTAESPSELRAAGRSIAQLAESVGADVVQTCSAALLADTDFAQPCVAVQHSCVATWWSAVRATPLPFDFAWRRDLVECGLNRASAVVAPSASFAAETARTYDLSRPVLPVYNGRYPAAARNLERRDFVFSAGRLWDEGKDIATIDSAAGQVDARWIAAGPLEGPNGSAIELDNVDTLGELSEARLAGLFAARPIFVSAALYEPFGLTALEAAQAGCALILSDIPTHRELWRGAAVFVEPGDAGEFASAARGLLDDSGQREELGASARARAQQFTPRAMAERMATIYERVAQPAQLELAGAA